MAALGLSSQRIQAWCNTLAFLERYLCSLHGRIKPQCPQASKCNESPSFLWIYISPLVEPRTVTQAFPVCCSGDEEPRLKNVNLCHVTGISGHLLSWLRSVRTILFLCIIIWPSSASHSFFVLYATVYLNLSWTNLIMSPIRSWAPSGQELLLNSLIGSKETISVG